MSHTKLKIRCLIPYTYSKEVKDILQAKYPKCFTGKLHPAFYQSQLPIKSKQYFKIIKFIKRKKAPRRQFSPSLANTQELYYLRKQRTSQLNLRLELNVYQNIEKLTNFQKNALKNYLQSQSEVILLTINLDTNNKDIYDLLKYWFKKLKYLYIQSFVPDSEIPVDQFKQLLEIVSPTLQSLRLFGFSTFPMKMTREINLCKQLQQLNILAKLFSLTNEYRLTDFSQLNLNQLAKFSCAISFKNPLIWLEILPKLVNCKELCLNLDFQSSPDKKFMNRFYNLIPKKLISLELQAENGKIKSNESYNILSQINVEEKFIITKWFPDLDLNYTKIFENKTNVSHLEISVQRVSLPKVSKALTQFTRLQVFKLDVISLSLGKEWPKNLREFFGLVALSELSIQFDENCTDIKQFCQMLQVCIEKSQQIREIYLIQNISQSELIPIVEFFLNQKRKNYFVALQNTFCPSGSIIEYYKYQYRRLRWEIN